MCRRETDVLYYRRTHKNCVETFGFESFGLLKSCPICFSDTGYLTKTLSLSFTIHHYYLKLNSLSSGFGPRSINLILPHIGLSECGWGTCANPSIYFLSPPLLLWPQGHRLCLILCHFSWAGLCRVAFQSERVHHCMALAVFLNETEIKVPKKVLFILKEML